MTTTTMMTMTTTTTSMTTTKKMMKKIPRNISQVDVDFLADVDVSNDDSDDYGEYHITSSS